MSTQPTRAQRRRLAKEMGKQQFEANGKQLKEKISQTKLMISCWLLLTSVVCFSIIKGFEMWADVHTYMTYIAWTSLIFVLLVGFIGWVKFRKTFVMSKKWTLGGFVGISLSIAVSLFFVFTMEYQITKARFANHLDNYKNLISFTEKWDQNDRIENCPTYRKDLNRLSQEVLQSDTIPSENDIRLVYSIEKVLYLGGCESNWEKLSSDLKRDNAKLNSKYPYSYSMAKNAKSNLYPKSYEGCVLEKDRSLIMDENFVYSTLEIGCDQIDRSSETLWIEGQFKKGALAYKKELEEKI